MSCVARGKSFSPSLASLYSFVKEKPRPDDIKGQRLPAGGEC